MCAVQASLCQTPRHEFDESARSYASCASSQIFAMSNKSNVICALIVNSGRHFWPLFFRRFSPHPRRATPSASLSKSTTIRPHAALPIRAAHKRRRTPTIGPALPPPRMLIPRPPWHPYSRRPLPAPSGCALCSAGVFRAPTHASRIRCVRFIMRRRARSVCRGPRPS